MGAHLGWGGTGVVERVDPKKAGAWRGQARGEEVGEPRLAGLDWVREGGDSGGTWWPAGG